MIMIQNPLVGRQLLKALETHEAYLLAIGDDEETRIELEKVGVLIHRISTMTEILEKLGGRDELQPASH